jgi:oligopeptide transport system substrate-binding protein
MSIARTLGLAASFAFTLAACGGGETNVTSGTRDGILHIGNGSEPQDLDPHTTTGVPEHRAQMALFEGLVKLEGDTLDPIPGAAESWSVSDDRRRYTFNLRRDGLWSNGDPVTAHDFVYSWRRLLSPALGAEYAYQLYYLVNAERYHKSEIDDFSQVGVRAVDDYTLVVDLNYPTPFFLSLLDHNSLYPVHQPTIERFGRIDEAGTRWTRPGNLVGNGPFTLSAWELNRVIIVEKNPLYWDAESVQLNEIHLYPIENYTTEERMFRSGGLHATTELPIDKISVYRQEDPDLLRINPYLGTYFYLVNTDNPPFDDPRVRRALGMTINRDAIVNQVTKGGQLPAYALTPPGVAGYTPRAAVPYDIDEARRLLAEAGYPNGEGFPEVELLYNTNESHQKIAVAIQQMWQQALNIRVSLVNQEWKVFIESQNNQNYDLSRLGWIGDYPDPNTFLDMFVTDGGNNDTGWSNAEYDRLIAAAAREADPEQRLEFFQQAEEILVNEMPVIPIYTYTRLFLISPDLTGWPDNILDRHRYENMALRPATGQD